MLNNDLTTTPLVKTYSGILNYSNSNPTNGAKVAIANYPGYTPVGIIKWSASASYDATRLVYDIVIDNTNHYLIVHNTNTYSGTTNVGISFTIAYVKNTLL